MAGAFVAAIFQITWKRMRNGRLLRRGEPGIKDVVFVTLWPLHAMIGAIAGSIAAGIDDSWITGAVAGAALPAFASVAWLIACLAQLRR